MKWKQIEIIKIRSHRKTYFYNNSHKPIIEIILIKHVFMLFFSFAFKKIIFEYNFLAKHKV